ncbi:MAG: cbb3-type cytochrome c oxidase subunit 3 [Bosea sp.]|nr:cbb3-type cytochrome c oxidase subunit 3 [Bosea sp. (in: a-proteobacteria)]
MMDYETMRHFADSWGLVYMVAIFLAAVFWVLRPRARQAARDAALIPFRDETGKDQTP